MSVLEHAKFRAGYDFLCIRAQVGEGENSENLKQDCQWWTDIQKQTSEQQRELLFNQSKQSAKKKRSRPKSRQAAKKKKVEKSGL